MLFSDANRWGRLVIGDFAAWATASAAAVVFCLLSTTQAQAQDFVQTAAMTANATSVFVEYGVPGQPQDVAVEAPGRVWVTLPALDAIGLISRTTPSQAPEIAYSVRYWVLPGSGPMRVVYGDGNVWFTERAANKIGRLNTTDFILEEFVVPTFASQPNGIAVAPNGVIWFAESAGNQLGKLDPSTGVITEYLYPTPGYELAQVAVANNGAVWFTAPNMNKVGFFNPVQERFSSSVSTSPYTRPIGLVVDSSNPPTPWVAANGSNTVGRFDAGTLSNWRWTSTPTADSGPFDLALDNRVGRSALFVTEERAEAVARFDIASDTSVTRVREFSLASRGCRPQGIDVDMDGSAWIACDGANTVIEWRAPYFLDNFLPLVGNRSFGGQSE